MNDETMATSQRQRASDDAPREHREMLQPAGESDVSFVVIAFNEVRQITRTLESILAQVYGGTIEVVVVDDGSTDGTLEAVSAVAERDPRVRLISLGRNRGRGFARHAGITNTRSRFIATVDADIVLPRGWLETCLREIESADAVAGTAVPDGDVTFVYRVFKLEPRPVGHTITVTGSNAVYRAEIFGDMGFDSTLREGEDVAFNHLLESGGKTTRAIEGLLVRHEESKSLGEALAWMFQSGRGAARQRRIYRTLRLPDLTYFGFLLSLIVAASPGPRRPPRLLVPFGYLGLAATVHVLRAFAPPWRRPHALIGAIAVDAAHLACYFAGRAAGPPAVDDEAPEDVRVLDLTLS